MKSIVCLHHIVFPLSIGIFLFAGCPCSYEVAAPDVEHFKKVVAVPEFRDSLKNNVLVEGMPIFVAEQVFRNCTIDTMKLVASVGSRQPLLESEGLFFHRQDPNIKVYLNTYRTVRGTLFVWYQYPDFYRLALMSKDSVYLYWEGGLSRTRIKCLTKPDVMVLDSVAMTEVSTAKVSSKERKGEISYWYAVSFLKRDTLRQVRLSNDLYPIMHLELDGNPISSFRWR